MKFLVGVEIGSYTFSVSGRTITLAGLDALELEQILLITNVTTGQTIFQFNNAALNGTIAGNVITLDPSVDLTGMANGDRLAIFIEYPHLRGVWGYKAGSNGTPSLPSGARVLSICAHATVAGSMTINGGDSVPIPANVAVNWEPKGNLSAPTIVFTGTDSYIVEYLT